MFFSWAARVAAIVILVGSIMKLVVAVPIAMIPEKERRDALVREYLGSPPSGRHIDKGVYGLILAFALGTLAEISFTLRAIRDK